MCRSLHVHQTKLTEQSRHRSRGRPVASVTADPAMTAESAALVAEAARVGAVTASAARQGMSPAS